jgi:hypothetical protein
MAPLELLLKTLPRRVRFETLPAAFNRFEHRRSPLHVHSQMAGHQGTLIHLYKLAQKKPMAIDVRTKVISSHALVMS